MNSKFLYNPKTLKDRRRELRKNQTPAEQKLAPPVSSLFSSLSLRYGLPSATDSEVLAALERVGLKDLANKLPDVLDTIIGESSAHQLSGGQKVRKERETRQ